MKTKEKILKASKKVSKKYNTFIDIAESDDLSRNGICNGVSSDVIYVAKVSHIHGLGTETKSICLGDSMQSAINVAFSVTLKKVASKPEVFMDVLKSAYLFNSELEKK